MSEKIKANIETAVYLVLIALIYGVGLHHWNGMYIDTDNYTYALRTVEWFKNPSWFEQKFMLTNYPFGEVSHWTRPVDVVMIAFSLIFMIFYPLKEAVFYGGLLVAPLFLFLTALILKKFGDEILNRRSRVALFVLLFVQDGFRKVFLFMRPDHHAFDIFLSVWLLWELYRFIAGGKIKPITLSALICALLLWINVEGFAAYALTLLFLYAGHIMFGYPYAALKRFTTVYAVSVGAAWLLNPPYEGFLYVDNGRLSILYAGIAAYVALSVVMAEKIQKTLPQFLGLGCAALILLCGLYFGGCLSSPLDVQIKEAFTNRVSEMESGTGFYYLSYPLIGLAVLFWLYHKKENPQVVLLLTVFLTGYLGLSVWAKRFAGYEAVYSALALAWGLSRLKIKNIAFSGLVFLLGLIEIIGFSVDALKKYDLSKPLEEEKTFNVQIFKKFKFAPGSVVSDTFFAPYIVWYGEQPTVASPYHKNVEGIVDNHRILFSEDEKEVVRLLKKHQVKTIILPLEIDTKYYKEPLQNCKKLYGKILGCKNYPAWLVLKIENAASNYVVLEIDEKQLPNDEK